MPADTRRLADRIDTEQLSGRLKTVHWLIISASFLITLLAWYGTQSIVTERARLHFEREAEKILELVTDRLRRYEDALWSAAAAIEANPGVATLGGWESYVERLDLVHRYPNVKAVNVMYRLTGADELARFVASQRHERPDFSISRLNDDDEHFIVTYVSPLAGNEAAVGLDGAHDPGRFKTLMRAAAMSDAQLTPPLELVQDATRTKSYILSVPFYRGLQTPELPDRLARLEGFVVMPLLMSSIVNGVLDQHTGVYSLRITDGDTVIHDDSPDRPRLDDTATIDTYALMPMGDAILDSDGHFHSQRLVDVYGRQWRFDIDSASRFSHDAGYLFPTLVLIGGLSIDILLLGIFLVLAKANRRALGLAQQSAAQLLVKADALAATNRELESFAYIVSHDLKTPLRGIQDLTDYIEEDLEPSFDLDDAHREARRNLGRIGQQVRRSNALIEGILDYSGVGMRAEQLIEVNVAQLLDDIVEPLPVRSEQLVRQGEFPVFTTYGIRLAQVLANLINNAFKYHHDPDKAHVVISVTEQNGWYRFSVQDDGPGIDRKFHSRVFEVFKTLQSRDAIESTGVGLSIVKKSVELLGGRIWIESACGEGTTMFFEWPKEIHEDAVRTHRAA